MPRCARRGVVEHRERQPRLEHLVRDLGRVERRLPRERPLLVRLERVRVPLARASCSRRCVSSASALDDRARRRARRAAIALGGVAARAAAASCRRCPSSGGAAGRRRAARPAAPTASSYCHVWQYTICDAVERGRARRRRAACRPPRRARPPPTSSSGSGAPASPTSSGCHVRCADADDARRARIDGLPHRLASRRAWPPALSLDGSDALPPRTPCGPFLGVLGRANDRARRRARALVAGTRVAARSSSPRPSQHALLRRLHRERRVGGDARARTRTRASSSSSRGDDRVEQAHLERRGRRG